MRMARKRTDITNIIVVHKKRRARKRRRFVYLSTQKKHNVGLDLVGLFIQPTL